MRRLLVLLCACGAGTAAPDARTSDSSALDASSPDGELADAPVLAAWSAPTSLMLPANADDPSMTADALELYFNLGGDIYVSTRETPADPWGAEDKVEELSSTSNETSPEVSPDGLAIYFASRRTPTLGGEDVWMATRESRSDPWGTPSRIVELSSTGIDVSPTTRDGLLLVLCVSTTNEAAAIRQATRASLSEPWSTPVELTELTTGIGDCNPMLSADGLTIVYDSLISNQGDLYEATRATTTSPFGTPEPITELNETTELEGDPWLSADGRHILFESSRGGSYGLWESSR